MGFEILDFGPEDYDACVRISRMIDPDRADTVEDWKHYDEHRDPKTSFRRWVARSGVEVIGWAQYEQNPWHFEAGQYNANCIVDAAHRGAGVGRALYSVVMDSLSNLDAVGVRVSAKDDQPSGLDFLRHRGFVEERRNWTSELDIASFDPSRFAGAEERVTSAGFEIATLADLMKTDPQSYMRFHHLIVESGKDVPRSQPYTPPELDRFRDSHLNSPMFMPDATYVAVMDGKYVGMSDLERKGPPGTIETGYTGVDPAYRGRGIALALKLRTIAYAKAHGIRRVVTGNDSANAPMLAINEALGFKRGPAWITLRKSLAPSGRPK